MIGKVGVASALLTITMMSSALACDCPLPKGLTTDQARLAYLLSRAPVAASLRIDDVHLRTSRSSDPKAVGNAVVVEQIKGRIAGRIQVETWGGDEGANCGLASALFEAASARKLLKVALHEVP